MTMSMGPDVRCPLCSAPHATCGPASTSVPVGEAIGVRERYTVDDLREYAVSINGVQTTAMLSPADAARLGAVPVVPPPGPAAVEDDDAPEVKARRAGDVLNTARTAINKARRS